jgi:hypothetical protein
MHGCHKVGVTIEGDFEGVLSHNDPNTKITEVNKGRRIQNISPKKHKGKTNNNSRESGG